MSTPEGIVKQNVRRALTQMQSEGIALWWHEPVTGGYGRSGIPDFEGCIKGLFFSIETKAKGGKQTALQMREFMKITDAKGCYLLIDEYNVSEVRSMLEDWVTLTYKAILKSTQIGDTEHETVKEGRPSGHVEVGAHPHFAAGGLRQRHGGGKNRGQQRIRLGGEVEDAPER